MFGKSRKSGPAANTRNSSKGPIAWDVPVFFGIIFALSIAEMCFTIDSFVYLQKKNKWYSNTERARMGFLIFSCVRTILLSAVYIGFHTMRKLFHNMLHTIFLVVSTILWVISGVIIHDMWGYVECANEGIADSADEFKSQIMAGLSECHEIKIIEILAWTIAAVSVVATIPVVRTAMRRRKESHGGASKKTAISG